MILFEYISVKGKFETETIFRIKQDFTENLDRF